VIAVLGLLREHLEDHVGGVEGVSQEEIVGMGHVGLFQFFYLGNHAYVGVELGGFRGFGRGRLLVGVLHIVFIVVNLMKYMRVLPYLRVFLRLVHKINTF